MSYAHLDPNDPAVFDALKDVMDSKTSTNWALFGYVPKTARLKVVDKGDGDVSEVTELVSDGKLMFAYLRKEMSETWKFVLIAWCGDGVPANIKGFFPTHKEEMEGFLHKHNFPYAAMISAREESDLDEAEIVKALNKTSTFIRARTAKDKPVEKLDDVRNRYWTKQRETDSKFKQDQIARQKQKEADAQADLESERLRMQRHAEDVLAQREAEREQAAETFRQEEAERTQRQNAYFQSQHDRVMEETERNYAAADAAASANQSSAAPVSRGNAAARFMAACQQPEQSSPAPRPAVRRAAPAAEPEPAQDSWGSGETYDEQPATETYEEQPAESYDQPAETYDEQPAESYDEQPAESYDDQSGAAGGEGQARALYDYEAAQDGDLAFHEGDVINLIDTSDPSGWWVGELNGYQGNFPSNFVERI